MLRVYFYLYLTLAVCLGVAAWLLETHLQPPPTNPIDLQLAKELLASQPSAKTPLNHFHLSEPLQTQLLSDNIISLKDSDNNIYYHQLAADKQVILSIGPFQTVNEQSHQSLISLAFYISVAIAVLIFTGPLLYDLNKLRYASKKMSSADFSAQVNFPSYSLLKSIGDTFDQMASTLNNREQSQRELINAVSHDFLTPISRAKFALEAHQENRPFCTSILQDIVELELLVDEFLTYAELKQCEPRIFAKHYDVEHLLQPCITKFTAYTTIAIEVHCTIESICVDQKSFHRLLQNLLGNAVRFAKSTIYISITATKKGTLLSIEDDGPGIPLKLREHLLKPFSKNESFHKTGYQGVGLGLSIVKQLCEWNNAQFNLSTSSTLKGAQATVLFYNGQAYKKCAE